MGDGEMQDEEHWPEIHAEVEGSGRLSPTLSASVHVSGAWTIVSVAGEYGPAGGAPRPRARRTDARHLVFDLRQVTFMDARGLDLVVRCQNAALQGGVACASWRRHAGSVGSLMLTGANREFTTFASVDKAMSAPVPGPWR